METLGFKNVKVSTLSMPGEIRERCGTDRVRLLAQGLVDPGQINPVVIRKSDGRWICGRDRAAAAIVGGLETILVHYVECSDDEAELIEVSENLHRRHDKDEQSRLALEIIPMIAKRVTADMRRPPDWPNGRPLSKTVVARRIVAAQRGITEQSVRRLEYKARKRRGEPIVHRGPPPKVKVEPGTIDTLGVEPDPAFLQSVVSVAMLLESAGAMIRKARANLEAITTPLPRVSRQALVRQVDELLDQLRDLSPKTVCPYCKTFEALTPSCSECDSAGWLGAGQLRGVHRELLDTNDVKVVSEGRTVSAADLFGDDEVELGSDDPREMFR